MILLRYALMIAVPYYQVVQKVWKRMRAVFETVYPLAVTKNHQVIALMIVGIKD